MTKRPGIIGPLLLIAIGLILLFINLGHIHLSIWVILWRFWPVILILIGLDIIARQIEERTYYNLCVLIGVVIIIGVIALAWTESASHPPTDRDLKNDMKGKLLIGKDLNNVDFEDKDLKGALLIGANMNDANLINADLRYAFLIGANMNEANFHDANLEGAIMIGANLNGANFTDANLKYSILTGSNMDGVNLCGADMRGAIKFGVETSSTMICPDCSAGPCW